jgi:hypothetical protein
MPRVTGEPESPRPCVRSDYWPIIARCIEQMSSPLSHRQFARDHLGTTSAASLRPERELGSLGATPGKPNVLNLLLQLAGARFDRFLRAQKSLG